MGCSHHCPGVALALSPLLCDKGVPKVFPCSHPYVPVGVPMGVPGFRCPRGVPMVSPCPQGCPHIPLFSSCPHDVPVVVPHLHGPPRCVPMVSLWCSYVPMGVPAAFPWVSPCSSDIPVCQWVSPWCPLPCPTCPPWSAARCWRPSALHRFWGVRTVPGTAAVPDISRDVGDVGGI